MGDRQTENDRDRQMHRKKQSVCFCTLFFLNIFKQTTFFFIQLSSRTGITLELLTYRQTDGVREREKKER